MNWNRLNSGTVYYFYIDSSTRPDFKTETFPTSLNILCPLYTAKSNNNNIANALSEDMQMCRSAGNICIRNDSYTTTSDFKTAMSGVYLLAELNTPTEESAESFTNPSRCYLEGTEEFIDGLTRDVMIPVGHESIYYQNKVIVPIADYVDDIESTKVAISALGTNESGRTTASRAYTTGEFFYKDRKMYKVLTSIASGATFTVGTNISETTLFAELTALA